MIRQMRSNVSRGGPMRGWRLRRRIWIVVMACALAVPGLLGAEGPDPEVVCRVNGDPVTRNELQRMLDDALARRRLQQEIDVGEPGSKEIERPALQKLVHRRLLLQEADRRNLTVTEKELEHALKILRSRFQDLRGFGEWMKERGLDDQSLFDMVRAQVLMAKVWAALVEDVRVPEERIEAYYEAHKTNLTIGEEVRLRIIAVESNAAAEEILAALRKGASFGRLARTKSLGMLAAQGGDTGWVDARTLPQPLHETVGLLKAGDVGGPMEKSADEFLVVGLQGRRPLLAKSLIEARSEIERRLLPEKQQEAIEAWLIEQEKKSNIEVLLPSERVMQGEGMGGKGEKAHAEKE
ncbi:MAG: SurA N-terminal domain-containing protein [Deltaproteobacteria bacterium]|nr:SurA N-terminal domain-containing protein [Deltaproteobacteria bacterium]